MSACCHQLQITTSTATSSPASSPSSSSTYSKSFDQLSISSSRLRLSRSASINHQRCGILLRSSETKKHHSRLWTIGSLGQGEGGGGILFGSDDGESQVNDHQLSFVLEEEERIGDVVDENSRYDLTKEEKEGSAASCGGDRDRDRDRKVEVLVAAAATVVLGVGNRVLYKLALVPLKHYPFFLAQIATFGYVLVYFSVLYFRYHAGIVTDEMLSLPKAPFLCVGLLEALAAASGMAAAAILSGESIPILSQTFLVWQLLLSALFLGRRYRINQIFGCFLVAIGVIITVASGPNTTTGFMTLVDLCRFDLLPLTRHMFRSKEVEIQKMKKEQQRCPLVAALYFSLITTMPRLRWTARKLTRGAFIFRHPPYSSILELFQTPYTDNQNLVMAQLVREGNAPRWLDEGRHGGYIARLERERTPICQMCHRRGQMARACPYLEIRQRQGTVSDYEQDTNSFGGNNLIIS